MISKFKGLLIFILLVFNFSLAYSAACCYGDNGIYPVVSGCKEGDVEVGPFTDTGTSFCSEYEDKRMGCVSDTGACFATVLDKKIYDYTSVYNSFNFDAYCASYKPFDNTCVGSTAVTLSGNPVNSGDTPGSGNGTIGNPITEQNRTIIDTGSQTNRQTFCSNAGDPFGFYVTQQSCESINLGSGNSCLFNPYLGGHLSAKFENFEENGIDFYENACIPRSEINECFDYKTQRNCEQNPSASLGDPDLEDGCLWVPSSLYAEDLFNEKSGICVNSLVDEVGIYDKRGSAFRLNSVKDPSFEQGSSRWVGVDSTKVKVDRYTFDGSKYYELGDGESISQRIFDLADRVSYSAYLYARVDSQVGSTEEIQLTITPYDFSGNVISSDVQTSSVRLSQAIGSREGVFNRVDFSGFTASANMEFVEFKITARGVSVDVDGVSFEPSSRGNVVLSQEIFKPVEVFSSQASRCSLCYDPLGLNLCTKTKATAFGDCSYMVTNGSEKYESQLDGYPKDENVFMDDPWQSQAIANSNLFCNMYVTQSQCEDPSSFVNSKYSSLHEFSGNTLCKWDQTIGCFKDSDNDMKEDTEDGRVRVANTLTSPTGGSASDFAYACDSLPPNSYVYFTATDSNGNVIALEQGFDELVGNVFINIEGSDVANLESCGNNTFKRNLHIVYTVVNSKGNRSWFRTSTSNIYGERMPIEDFFKGRDSSGNLIDLIENGDNSITIEVKDQSGNIGKRLNFNINIDSEGPEIVLNTPTPNEFGIIPNVLGPNTEFDFTIRDLSGGIGSCNYTLTSLSGAPLSFYTPTGNFDVSQIANDKYSFKLPIFDSESNGDTYGLQLSCFDIFSQRSDVEYIFAVDYNTDLVVTTPRSFVSYLSSQGVFNSQVEFNAASVDSDLNSCRFEFPSQGLVGSAIVLDDVSAGFNLPGYSDLFVKNISSTIGFSSDGVKSGQIICSDVNGNQVVEDLNFIYDTASPSIVSYELNGLDSADLTIRNLVKINGNYYTYSDTPGLFNVTLDGTGSHILRGANLTALTASGPIPFNILTNFRFDLDETSHVANVVFPPYTSTYDGVPIESGLNQMRYELEFFDLAGNSQRAQLNYFYDVSVPKIEIGGDFNQVGDRIFTSELDPNFRVSFGAPNYRTYTCDISIRDGNFQFTSSFSPGSTLDFRLSDVTSNVDLFEGEVIRLDFNCVDIYGISLSDSFSMFYDNTPPELNRIYLEDGNEKFFMNWENLVYQDLIDRLVFDLNDTSEVGGYSCSFQVEPLTNDYVCDDTPFELDFTSGGLQVSDNLNLIAGTNNNDGSGICYRTDDFFVNQRVSIVNGYDLETDLRISALCSDGAGFNTQIAEVDVLIDYTQGSLVDMTVLYENGFAYPLIRSTIPFSQVVISLDGTLNTLILELDSQTRDSNGFYIYAPQTGIDLSGLASGTTTIYGHGLDGSGEIVDTIAENLFVDNTAPHISLNIPDVLDSDIYSTEFIVLFDAFDLNSEVGRVELFVNNRLAFTSDNLSVFDATITAAHDGSLNYFSNLNTEYTGNVFFNSGVVSNSYTFRAVAYDSAGNSNETSINVLIKDGIVLLMRDSSNSRVDPSGVSWVTKASGPTLDFETSKVVSFCEVYPFVDEEWVSLTGNSNIANVKIPSSPDPSYRNTDTFSFDLSSVSGYDLSALYDSNSQVRILCSENNQFYQFTRNVRYLNYLPDYVLHSSEGFVFNEDPYETTLKVRSVGPYRYVTCRYGIDDSNYVDLQGGLGVEFSAVVNLDSLAAGNHEFNLICEDILGTSGPDKVYPFVVNRDPGVVVSDLRLSRLGIEFEPDSSNQIKIGSTEDLVLRFNVNKKENVLCNYRVNPTSGFFSGVVNFFRNVFDLGKVDMSSPQAFEFAATGLDFGDGLNRMTVDCSISGTNEFTQQTYDVIFEDDVLDIGITRVGN